MKYDKMLWTASSCRLVLVLSILKMVRVRRLFVGLVAGQAFLDQQRRFLKFFSLVFNYPNLILISCLSRSSHQTDIPQMP